MLDGRLAEEKKRFEELRREYDSHKQKVAVLESSLGKAESELTDYARKRSEWQIQASRQASAASHVAATAEYQISQADNVVVVAGHRNDDGGEGTDRSTVVMPRVQAELIRDSIAPLAQKYGKKIVVWIQAKTMVDVSAFKDLPSVGAIVWSSFNGMYQGKAMADK